MRTQAKGGGQRGGYRARHIELAYSNRARFVDRARYKVKEALSECGKASCRTFHASKMAKADIAYSRYSCFTELAS